MIMNPGMLLFGLLASFVAFFLVYSVAKAKLGGNKKTMARAVGAVLGTVVFIAYFSVIVWFNTNENTVAYITKVTVYAAPFVLSLLMIILVILSQPPKKKEPTKQDEEMEKEEEEKEEGTV